MSNWISKQVIQTWGGSGTPWGADTQVQVNDGGVFAGYPKLRYFDINWEINLWEENWYGWLVWAEATTIDADWSDLWVYWWIWNGYGNWGALYVFWWAAWNNWSGWDIEVGWWVAWTYEWDWWNLTISWWDVQSSDNYTWEGGDFFMNWWQWRIRGWDAWLVGGSSNAYWGTIYFEWWLWAIGGDVNFSPWYSVWAVTDGIATFAINNLWTGYALYDIFTVDTGSTLAYFQVIDVGGAWEVNQILQALLWSGYSVGTWFTTTNTLWTWTWLTIDILTLVSWWNGKIYFQQPNYQNKVELDISNLTADRKIEFQDASWTPAFLSQIGKDEFWLTVDWAGAVVTTGSKWFRYMWYDGTITGWNVTSDVSWSIVFDIKRSGVSIAGTEKPTLSSQSSNSDLTLTTWTTAITAWDELEFIVDSASTITRATLTILITKAP